MANKPSSVATLDSGSPRFGAYLNYWPFLEGVTTSSADKKSGNTLTLSSSGLWAVNGSGDPIIRIGTPTAQPLAPASPISFDGKSDWAIAVRFKEAVAGGNGLLIGDNTTTDSFIGTLDGQSIRYRDVSNVSDVTFPQTGTIDVTTSASPPIFLKYVCTNATVGLGTLQIFQGGSQVGTDATNFNGTLTINTLGNAYTSTTFALVGDLEALYLLNALSAGDRTALTANFYVDMGASLAAGAISISSHTDTAVTVAGAACTGGTSTFTYQFQHSPDNGSNAPTGSWTNVGSAQSGVASAVAPSNVTDTGLSQTTKYWYRYTVTDSAGTPVTANATPVSVTTYTTATAYTLTDASPASGATGVASGNFTVTSNGYLGSTVNITPALAPISGSFNGLTSGHVTLATGNATSVTFTLTPSSAGVGTISVTNSASLSNPSSVTYTAFTVTTLDLTTSIADNGSGTNPAAYIQLEGGAVLGPHAGESSYAVIGAASGVAMSDAAMRFKGTISNIDLRVYQNGSPLRLIVDGTDGPVATLATTSSYANTSGLISGLDSTTEHDYVLCWGNTSGMFLNHLIITGTINTTPLVARDLEADYGDSITQGTAGPSTGDSTLAIMHHKGRLHNVQTANRGIGSTQVSGSDSQAGKNRTGDLVTVPTPKIISILYGRVDVNAAVDPAVFGADYGTMLTSIRSAHPGVPIICHAILKQSSGDTSQVAYNAQIKAAVAAQADILTVYRDGASKNYDGTQGLHPNEYASPAVAVQMVTDERPFLPVSYAAAADVRLNINRGDGTLGTCHVPTASQVLTGIAVDATTGNFVPPIVGNVLIGVTFGASSGSTGTGAGPGPNATALTFTTDGTTPIANATAWITSDSAGLSPITQELITNGSGQAVFKLTTGVTYYANLEASGYRIRNQAFTA